MARSSDEPRIVAVSRFASQKTARSLKTHPWELSNLLPDQGTETGCRNHSFQAWSTDQMTVLGSNQNQPSQASRSDCLHATHLLVYRLRSNDDARSTSFAIPPPSRVFP